MTGKGFQYDGSRFSWWKARSRSDGRFWRCREGVLLARVRDQEKLYDFGAERC